MQMRQYWEVLEKDGMQASSGRLILKNPIMLHVLLERGLPTALDIIQDTSKSSERGPPYDNNNKARNGTLNQSTTSNITAGSMTIAITK